MYPYSPSPDVSEDEPTMADLRGVLPGQRPPMDPTVLEEPTSEVPVIRPGAAGPELAGDEESDVPGTGAEATVDAGTDPAAGGTTDPVEPAAGDTTGTDDPAATGTTDPAATGTTDPEPARYPGHHGHDAATETETEPIAESEDEMEISTTGPTPGAGNGQDPTPPAVVHPATTPPVVSGFGFTPTGGAGEAGSPPAASEMAKMSWNPAPADGGTTTTAEPPVADLPGTVPAPVPAGPTGVGDQGGSAAAPIALWSGEDADRLRAQWRELQAQFIDDPAVAVAGAKTLVTETVQELADTLLAAQDGLDPYRDGDQVDTETMRLAMRRYREFLDRVLAL